MTRADKWTVVVVAPLVVVMVLLMVDAWRDRPPVYPMPIHPGTQVILHEADKEYYGLRFINSTAPIIVATAAANTDCKMDFKQIGQVVGDGEIKVTPELHLDICATVQPNQFPMVYECWPAPAMAGTTHPCEDIKG